MRAREFLAEAKYDYSLADYEATPYDPGFEHIGYELKKYNEPHIGPQEGKYLNLMLRGIKPATVISSVAEKELFAPYLKDGTLKLAAKDGSEYDNWFITLPGEEWRGKKLSKLWQQQMGIRNADPYDQKAEMTLDAKIGRLLGIPKESVRYFLKTRY